MSESAVAKRAERALGKLRAYFMRHGVTVTSAAGAGEMILRHGTIGAPAHLASSAAGSATANATAATLAATASGAIARSASRLMLWTKVKSAAVVLIVSSIAIATAGATVAHFARAASPGGRGGGGGDVMELQDVVFDPIGPGKNVAHVKLKTPAGATTRKSAVIIMEARSNDGGAKWKGYMRFGGASAGGTSDTRIVFQIPEPFGRNAGVTVNVYRDDQPTAEIWKSGRTPPTLYTRQFTVGKLPQRNVQWDQLPRASDAQAAQAAQARALLA